MFGRAQFLAAVIAAMLCVLATACGPTGDTAAPAASTSATQISTSAAPAESASATPTPSPSPTPSTSAGPTAVDPAPYAVSNGSKYLFTFPTQDAACWLEPALADASGAFSVGAPYVSCDVQFVDQTPTLDRSTGLVGAPASVVIDGRGTFQAGNTEPPDIQPVVLPVGSSLTVAHMTCEMLAESTVHCSAQTGEFTIADGVLTVIRDEPSPYKASGAGKWCDTVTTAVSISPVIILAGKITCEGAVAVIQKYLDLPPDINAGNTNLRMFDGFTCTAPTAAISMDSGIGISCYSPDVNLLVPALG